MGEGVLLRPKASWFKINIYHLLIHNSRTTWPLRFNCSFWVPWNVLCKMNVLLFTNIWQNFTIHVWVLGYLIFPSFWQFFHWGALCPTLTPWWLCHCFHLQKYNQTHLNWTIYMNGFILWYPPWQMDRTCPTIQGSFTWPQPRVVEVIQLELLHVCNKPPNNVLQGAIT